MTRTRTLNLTRTPILNMTRTPILNMARTPNSVVNGRIHAGDSSQPYSPPVRQPATAAAPPPTATLGAA
eukprot:4391258-Prymnesium_polylepis.1